MIDARQARLIIRDTTEAMRVDCPVVHRLVEVIMLMESGFNAFFSDNGMRHGFIQITKEEMCEKIRHIIGDRLARDMIYDVSMVDVGRFSDDDLFSACAYNISFQTALVVLYFRSLGKDRFLDIEEVIDAYLRVWKSDYTSESRSRVAERYIKFDREARKL